MNSEIKKLYQSVILHHNKTPVGYEKHPEATNVIEAYNPLCGDRFTLYFEVETDRITSFHFHGFGCAISKAATSVLVKHLQGQTIEEAEALVKQYFKTIQGEKGEVPNDFTAFAAAKSFPGRMKCATLSWEELQTFLNQAK